MALIKQVYLRSVLLAVITIVLIMEGFPLKVSASESIKKRLAEKAKVRETIAEKPEIRWSGPVWVVNPSTG